MVIESPLIEQRPVGLCPLNHPALCRGFSCKTVQQRIGGAGFTAGNPESHDNKTITERNYVVAIRNEHSQNHSRERFVPVKANFHIGLNFFCAIILTTICGASGAQIVRLASPEAVVGAPPDSCRPALTGEGGPVAWQVLLVHNRAALAETSRVAVDNRFPLCVVDTVKASDVDVGVSFTPIAGKIDQAAGLMFRVKDANNYYVARANALENNVNLYHVVKGVRRQIAGVNVSVVTGKTQQLGARIEGDTIKVSLDGRQLIAVNDRTIQGSGAVGLWTKADSVTAFYELTISVLRE